MKHKDMLFPLLLILAGILVAVFPIGVFGDGGVTVELRVATGSDDAEETPSGAMYTTSSDLELVYDNYVMPGNQTVGIRFNTVNIPVGASILRAYVQFQVDEPTTEATSLVIRGEDADNAGPFFTSTGNISSRQLTTAAVGWVPLSWTVVGEAGPAQQTPDISSVIQEIVDRPGWSNGNSLGIIITGTGRRVAESYEGDSRGAPLLHVEYTTGLVNQAPAVTITSPQDNSTRLTGLTIDFRASAWDTEDGDLTADLVWTSSLDGVIGRGGSFARSDLSLGFHEITAFVTDRGGRTGQGRVLLTIDAVSQSVVRGPYLQCGTPNSVVVRWRTMNPTDSRVRYGTDPGILDGIVNDLTVSTEHEIKLAGLEPARKYYYSIGSSAESLSGGDTCYFVTAPLPESMRKSRIWVIGDTDGSLTNQKQVRDAYYTFTGAVQTDLLLGLGDLSDQGRDTDYQKYIFDTYRSLLRNSTFWPCFGNRDGNYSSSSTQTGPYYDIFTLPKNGEAGGYPSGTEAYYSFNYGNIHFISLNSIDVSRQIDGPMLTWLANDLAFNTRPWVIAFWHHPPYSRGLYDSDTDSVMKEMREIVVPLLDDFGVDLVLSGHNNSYERSFLIDGHYGTADTLTNGMVLDNGAGRIDLGGAYVKPSYAMTPHQGAVYMVTSTSSQYCTSCPLNHPAMYFSSNMLGSVVLDVSGERIDVTFLDKQGIILDYFTISKINQPPVVRVTAPANGSSYKGGDKISFSGTASDAEDGNLTANLSWTSSLDGIIGTGGSFTLSNLSVGAHTIIASVTDSGGLPGQYQLALTVNNTNQPPIANAGPDQTVTDSDKNGSESVSLNGSGSSDADGTIASYVWKEGGVAIASGVSPTVLLGVGVHTLTLEVTDNGGMKATDTAVITVKRTGRGR